MPDGGVVQRSLRDAANQHLLERHGLRAQLQAVGVFVLGAAVFVLNRQDRPPAALALQGDTAGILAKFHHVADAGKLQAVGDHPQAPHGQKIPPALIEAFVVAARMFQPAFCRAAVFGPLFFHVDERPLPPAEAKVLDARKGQVLLFALHQLRRSQVTPAGRSSSTVTV